MSANEPFFLKNIVVTFIIIVKQTNFYCKTMRIKHFFCFVYFLTGINLLSQSYLPEGNWKLDWSDEFDGPANSQPASHWFFFDAWGDENHLWRDAVYTNNDAYLDGNGKLVIRARLENDTLKTSYLQTYNWSVDQSQWTLFGPEEGTYMEASIKFTELVAGGLWCAFWLYSPSNTYDGNPATGTEMDIMEYPLGYGAPGSWTALLNGGNTLNYFNVANHWNPNDDPSVGKYVYAADYGKNLRDGNYHKFGVEWYKDKAIYYLDGDSVFSTTQGVAQNVTQAIILSIEYDAPPDDAWGLNENILDYADDLPDYFLIDYVRVFRKEFVQLQVKVFLEGAYNSGNNEMFNNINSNIPLESPYPEDSHTVSSVPSDVVDWVLVELRETPDGAAVVSKSVFLHKDGRIVNDDATSGIIKLNALENDYYVVIKHRNHLPVMSKNKITLHKTSSELYDFTTSESKFYGTGGAVQLENGVWGMWSGDADGSGVVDAGDRNSTWNDRNKSGYETSDVDLSGVVDAADRNKTWNNRNKSSALP